MAETATADTPFFKARIEGKIYTLDKLTLGQARILKQQFDVKDIANFSLGDPDHLAGVLFLCLRDEKPDASPLELLAEVDGIDVMGGFEPLADEKAEESDESPLAEAVAEESAPPEASSSETIPETPGTPA